MASKFVTLVGTFTGIITEADSQPPLGIWGPNDPRPTLPIAGWDPIHGTWPNPPSPPLGIWGPGDPRPTLPIAGWNPGTGQFPPWVPPPGAQPPTFPVQLPEGNAPGAVWAWVPGKGWGWVFVPSMPGGAGTPVPPTPNPT